MSGRILMFRPLVALIPAIATSLAAQTGTGNERFIRRAELRVERCVDACGTITPELQLVRLDARKIREIRAILVNALRRNRREEAKAIRQGEVPGGVPGFVTYAYRFTFTLEDHSSFAWLHLGAGMAWLQGDARVGNIEFTQAEIFRLNRLAPR